MTTLEQPQFNMPKHPPRYQNAYDYLISLNNLPRQEYLADKRRPAVYLRRLGFLLNLLGNPEKKIPHYIHVAGTSGKGSVCLMLDSILRAAGKKTGLLTSPHPSAITERWEINGRAMSKQDFIELTSAIKPRLDEYINCSPYDFPSFFEIVTAMGLLYFAQNKVEWAVMETGLGGRYDSTNVIPRKDMAIITNIGRDHLELIGPTTIDVAREKAGIIKRGCKVLTASDRPKILSVIKREAKQQRTNIKILDIGYSPTPVLPILVGGTQGGGQFNYQNTSYCLPVIGRHQISNAILAIEAARWLGIDEKIIKLGLSKVKLPLRLEIVCKKPLIILDGAHNPDKMKTTIETVKNIKILDIKKIHLVVGFSADKDIKTMLKQLASLKPASIACTRFTSNPFRQVADPRTLARQCRRLLPAADIKIFLDPLEALRWSRGQTKTGDLLLATGSIFLSGELRHKMRRPTLLPI